MNVLRVENPELDDLMRNNEQSDLPKYSPEVVKLTAEYCDIFKGMGKMKDVNVHLLIDENVKPIAQKHRRIPFHMRSKVESELEKLQKADIIEKVESPPTDWISPIVVVPKPNSPEEYRLCVNMVKPNTAIKRIRHVIPTIDDRRHDINGCKVFSKLDLNQGYHQLELDEASSTITTFSTHVGRYRYKRLNFGTCSAAEICHEEVRKKLAGIPSVRNIHDDVLIGGRRRRIA